MNEMPDHVTSQNDRRAMPRAGTRRSTEFSADEPKSVIGHGTIVDISPNGLQIHTRTPENIGRSIEITVFPKAEVKDGIPVRVRGRIVWRTALPGGEWAMGIRLAVNFTPPESGAGPHIKNLNEARQLMGEVSRQLKERKPDESLSLTLVEAVAPSSLEVEFKADTEPEEKKKKNRPWLVFWLFLGGLLTLLLFAFLACLFPPLPRASKATEAPPTPPKEISNANALPRRTPNAALNRAQFLLQSGHAPESIPYFKAVVNNLGATGMERFSARLGQAEAEAVQGRKEPALAIIKEALDQPLPISPEWKMAAEQYITQLEHVNPGKPTPVLLRDGLELAKGLPPQNTNTAARISISLTHFLLTVHHGNAVVGVYPVGLGMNNSTPQGDFVVVNKIVHPDWYHQGKVIKAGDPENPLGSRWIGLGNKQGATPYGIHPTREPDSIRSNKSRGCIRMRPGDAEHVFDWCAVGTPVHIAP